KVTIYAGDHYKINKANSSKNVMINNIRYNQLSLYFFEPVNIRQIYSDNFERFLTIEKKNDYYQLKLPDGNTTRYYYANGICSKVKVEHNLFNVDFILLK
ncbi:MAG TPA: DUF6134 family protein, partial [Chitinophagaceae bacterium]